MFSETLNLFSEDVVKSKTLIFKIVLFL